MNLVARLGVVAALYPLVLVGCVDNPEITALQGNTVVTIQVDGLEPLPGSLNYQAWLIMGEYPDVWGHPVVVFDVNEDGELVDPVVDTVLSGTFRIDVDREEVLGLGISIEASTQLLTYSSYTFVLGGDFSGGQAQLSSDHAIALGRPFSGASGRFVLATPTDLDLENELSGIWFMNPTMDPPAAGLELPEAPLGWNYESWVVLGGETLSMGRFLLPSQPDSAAPYSGEEQAPNFPGEDFLVDPPPGLTFPPDLAGAVVFVTLEPQGDLDVAPDDPFFLRFLEATIPDEPATLTVYEMTATGEFLPTGSATIEEYR